MEGDGTEGDGAMMREAIRLSVASVAEGGGPFGCVIVREGRIVGQGANRVTRDNDPTAHAEVVAIRDACRRLGSFQLEGCDVYASCEPCPMCLAALYWARPKRVFFAATAADAAAVGFDDAFIDVELGRRPAALRAIPLRQMLREEALAAYAAWTAKADRTPY
jgi:tRNA(Arg) A34 adenosine deaminase TadA